MDIRDPPWAQANFPPPLYMWDSPHRARYNDCVNITQTHATFHRLLRAKAVIGITDFCTRKVPVPPLDRLLPPSLLPESRNLLHQLRRVSRYLAKFQYVRVVDKGAAYGAGEMWGLCSAWVWEKVEEFMISENFARTNWTQREWKQNIAKVVKDMKLQCSEWGRLCILYVLAKAKSLRTRKWVFRGISAALAPILNQQQLRIAARSFTCMLRMLQGDIPHNFQCTDIKEASRWFRFVADKGARSLTELDCKNNLTT